jgi:hypothetical protein
MNGGFSMNKDFIIGWKGDGTPVYFCDFETDLDAIKTLDSLSPAGAVAVLAINRVSPEFFDGSPFNGRVSNSATKSTRQGGHCNDTFPRGYRRIAPPGAGMDPGV